MTPIRRATKETRHASGAGFARILRTLTTAGSTKS